MEDNKDTNLFQIPLIPKNVELFAENSSNRITENLAKNINQTEEMVIEEIIHKEEVKEEEMIEEEDDNVKIDDDSDVSYEENEFLAQNIEEEKLIK